MKKKGLLLSVLLILGLILTMSPAFAASKTAKDTKVEKVAAEMAKINLNSADVEALAQLPGIGEKTAQKIVEYRKANGKFKKIEDLLNVKGIGQKKFDKLKSLLSL
ncbi:MAG: competence protein ComEA [Deltaproteobacteria bacterium]|nr:MAG: competence protein ComEA [Deltaproteobacteria bacterium]